MILRILQTFNDFDETIYILDKIYPISKNSDAHIKNIDKLFKYTLITINTMLKRFPLNDSIFNECDKNFH